MPRTPPLITRNLITILGAVYSALFYGIYLITLGLYFHSLLSYHIHSNGAGLQKSALQPFSLLLLSAVIVLAVIMTAEMVNSTTYSVYYLAVYSVTDESRLLPQSVHLWSSMIWLADVLVATLLSDIILIYRTWVISGRTRLCAVFPTVTTVIGVACFAAALPLTIQSAKTTPGVDTVKVGPALKVLGSTAWLSTILTNLYCTIMIVWHLRQASSLFTFPPAHNTKSNAAFVYEASNTNPSSTRQNHVGARFNHIARVVADSGALNTFFALVLAAAYLINPTFANCVASGTIQVVGISFNLMAYRVRKTEPKSSITHPLGEHGVVLRGEEGHMAIGVAEQSTIRFQRFPVTQDSGEGMSSGSPISQWEVRPASPRDAEKVEVV